MCVLNHELLDNNERVRQHFYTRISNEVRIILEVWQRALTQEWTRQGAEGMREAAGRLSGFAERLELPAYGLICAQLLECLEEIKNEKNRLTSSSIEKITVLMQSLSQNGSRQGDDAENSFVVPILRRPLHIALADVEQAAHLSEQLAFFGLQGRTADCSE